MGISLTSDYGSLWLIIVEFRKVVEFKVVQLGKILNLFSKLLFFFMILFFFLDWKYLKEMEFVVGYLGVIVKKEVQEQRIFQGSKMYEGLFDFLFFQYIFEFRWFFYIKRSSEIRGYFLFFYNILVGLDLFKFFLGILYDDVSLVIQED